MSRLVRQLVLLIIISLILSSVQHFNAQTPEAVGLGISDFLEEASFVGTTYGVGLWGAGSNVLINNANDALFQNVLIPMGVRFIWGLDIGWYGSPGNTSDTDIGYRANVDTFLTLADKYGVLVTFNSPIKDYKDSTWAKNKLDDYPSLTTYNNNGQAYTDDYIRIDHPDAINAIYDDLTQLYSYYGSHSSWIGFGPLAGTDGDGYTGNIGRGGGWMVHQMRYNTILNFTRSRWYSGNGCDPTIGNIVTRYKCLNEYHNSGFYSFRNFIQDQQNKIFIEAEKRFAAYSGKRWVITLVPDAIQTGIGENAFYIQRRLDDASAKLDIVGSYASDLDNIITWRGYYRNIAQGAPSYGNSRTFLWGSLSHDNDYPRDLTPWQIGKQYLMDIPFKSGSTWVTFDWVWGRGNNGIQNLTEQAYSRSFGEILNRMKDVGGYYGEEKNALRVLAIGPGTFSVAPQFLTPAVNLTVVYGGNSDGNLTRYGDLSQFDSILLAQSTGGGTVPLTNDAKQRINNYVYGGGGLVFANGWPYDPDFRYTMGYNIVSQEGGGSAMTVSEPNHPILKPYGESVLDGGYSWYQTNSYNLVRIENESGTAIIDTVAKGPRLFTNNHGAGRSAFIGWSFSSWDYIGQAQRSCIQLCGSPRDSFITLVTNALFWASGKESLIPTWWYDEYKGGYETQSWDNNIYYSIQGSPGNPVLLWLTSNASTTENFEIHLNSEFYGIDYSGWVAINVRDWSVINKSTSVDISLNVAMPPKTWSPIYIANYSTNLDFIYSNVKLMSKSISVPSATYVFRGPYDFTSWLVVNSQSPIQSVSTSNFGTLTQYSSVQELNSSSTQSGYYFDEDNKIAIIKFKTAGDVEVTINQQGSTMFNVSIDPDGGRIIVDGLPIISPTNFSWAEASSHTLETDLKYSPSPGIMLSFVGWTDGNTSNPRTIDIFSDESYTAQWAIQYYLTLNSPYAIIQGTGWYDENSIVQISIENMIDQGNGTRRVFQNWSGDSSDSSTITTVIMDCPKNITALWYTQYRLMVFEQPDEGGSTSPSMGVYWYYVGSEVTVSQTANAGYSFSNWTLDGYNVGSPSTYNVTMSVPHILAAVFSEEKYPPPSPRYEVLVDPGSGRVFVDGQLIEYSQKFYWTEGSRHVIEADTAFSSNLRVRMFFVGWSDGDATNPRAIVVRANSTYRAQWATQYSVSISVTPSEGGYSDPAEGVYWFNAGSLIIFEAISEVNYGFDRWIINAISEVNYGSGFSIMDSSVSFADTFSMVIDSPYDLTVIFTLNGIGITIDPNGGSVSWDGEVWSTIPITRYIGSEEDVTFFVQDTVVLSSGERLIFDEWNDGSESRSRTMRVMADTFFHPRWRTQYQLTIVGEASIGGSTTPSKGIYWFDSGSQINVSQIANSGYKFFRWLLDGEDVGGESNFIVLMTAPHTLKAEFGVAETTVMIDPVGGRIFVDDSPITSKTVFTWLRGSIHTIDPDDEYSPTDGTRLRFTQWSDGSSFDPIELVADLDINYTAQWTTQHRLTILVSPEGAGKVVPGEGEHWVREGRQIGISASPNQESEFNYWLMDGIEIGFNPSVEIVLDSPHTIAAVFSIAEDKIINIDPNGGRLLVDGEPISSFTTFLWKPMSSHLLEAESSFLITEATRRTFDGWSDGESAYSRTIIVEKNATYRSFWITQHYLTFKTNIGSLSASSGWFDEGEVVELTAFEIDGYTFQNWILDGTVVLDDDRVVMDEPHSVLAVYLKQDFRIAISYLDELVTPPSIVRYMITITPENGFEDTITFSLSISNLPQEIEVGINPAEGVPPFITYMSVKIPDTVPSGTYIVEITAASSSINHTYPVTINVQNVQQGVLSSDLESGDLLPLTSTILAGTATIMSVILRAGLPRQRIKWANRVFLS